MRRNGFTIIELGIVMGIILTIIAVTVPNLLGARSQVEINSALQAILSDIKQQQLKAMLGDTEGRGVTDSYGVHFETESYTLFYGPTYQINKLGNSVVDLPGSLQFSGTNLPSAVIVFSPGSGEVAGLVAGADYFTLFNPANNQTRQATFNRLGVVTGVQ